MEKLIEHAGRVVYVVGSRVDVEITVGSACGTCQVRNACGMHEAENKLMSLCVEDGEEYVVGDEVVVSITRYMGVKAVTYSYIIPFFIMVSVLLTMTSVQDNEIIAGCTTLGAAALYYVGLFIFRDKIKREILFGIRKNKQD